MQRLQSLSTTRTIISEYTEHEFELVSALEHDPDVMRYLDGANLDPAQNKKKFAQHLDYYQEHPGLGVWKTCLKDGTHIGNAVLNRPALSTTGLREGPIQIGYQLHKKFWNQGYASELASTLLEYAFTTLQLPYVIAITGEENIASSRVMVKTGMHYRGKTTDYYNHELCWYQIEHQEWLDFTT